MSGIDHVRVRMENVRPGMVLARMVVTDRGRLALTEGTVLTEKMVSGLADWGIATIDIKNNSGLESSSIPSEDEVFRLTYEQTIQQIKQIFENIRTEATIPLLELRQLVDDNLHQMVNCVGVVNYLQQMRRWDDYTFYHAVNVSVISGLLGKWMSYEAQQVRDLLLAGLLHDVGKTRIPLAILNKPDKLTVDEMNIMKRHASYGYDLVKAVEDLPVGVRFAVLQHHERMNGTGYPTGLPGEMIDDLARIVAVADIYDAMTSERAYRHKLTPFTVVETLVDQMFDELDTRVCTAFLNNVRQYFIGNKVILSDGEQAEVVYLSNILAAKPIVRTKAGAFLDLEQRRDVHIVGLAEAE